MSKLNPTAYDKIKALAELQSDILTELMNHHNIDYLESFIGFESEESGQYIVNPFLSECMRFDVDPIEYYGEDFLQSGWKIFF